MASNPFYLSAAEADAGNLDIPYPSIRSHLLIAASGEILEGADLRTCRRIASFEDGSKVIPNSRRWVRPANWGFHGHPRPYAITTVNLPPHLA